MDIEFAIGNIAARLNRDWFTGDMKITTPDESVTLQSPLNPGTHVSFRLTQRWERTIAGHLVKVEKTRPLFFAGFRPHAYRIFVDGQLAAEASGM